MARWGRPSQRSRPAYTAPASQAERDQAKQIIIARVEYLDQIPILTNITGNWPRHGQVVAFHLDIARGGKPKALMFVVPSTAPAYMLKTEIMITTGQPPEGAVPVAQFRNLCFYRVIDKMREWLEEADPEDDKDVLHFLALFELQVKNAMRRRTLTLTPQVESQWNKYKGCRTLYMEPGTEGEKQAARAGIVRIVKRFMSELNGKG